MWSLRSLEPWEQYVLASRLLFVTAAVNAVLTLFVLGGDLQLVTGVAAAGAAVTGLSAGAQGMRRYEAVDGGGA